MGEFTFVSSLPNLACKPPPPSEDEALNLAQTPKNFDSCEERGGREETTGKLFCSITL